MKSLHEKLSNEFNFSSHQFVSNPTLRIDLKTSFNFGEYSTNRKIFHRM